MSDAPTVHPLDERYGRRPSRGRRRLVALIGGAVLLAATVFVGVRFADQPVRADTLAYQHVDASHISVTFQTVARPGTAMSCTVQALDDHRAQVGFQQVDVPAQDAAQTARTVVITTQSPAVSAQVVECERA